MKVSRTALANYNIAASHWFATNSDRDLYFIQTPDELIAGVYCAVGGDPESTDVTSNVWQLQQYNGNSWILTAINENYALIITNNGLKAVSNAQTGQVKIKIKRIRIIAESLLGSELPLIYFTNDDFLGNNNAVPNTVVIDWEDNGTTTSDFATHLTYKNNLSNNGLQYTVTLEPDDISVSGMTSFYVGSIGLYIEDQANPSNDVLFGIATLASPVYKVGTSAEGLGSSLKFYLNAVLDNLGYVSDVSIITSEVNSVPEVDSDVELSNFGGLLDPYNLYLVNSLYGTNVPAIAVRKGDPSNLAWTYFTPSDNVLHCGESDFVDVDNYMAVTYDENIGKYVRASGDSQSKAALGIRVNNNIVFAGTVRNFTGIVTTYNYNFTIENPGINYCVDDIVYFVYQVPGSESKKTIKLRVTSVSAAGEILDWVPSTESGSIALNDIYNIIYSSGSGNIPGSGAQVNVSSRSLNNYSWDFGTQGIVNKPIYVDTGDNVGKLTTTITESFVGWATGPNTLQMGLDIDAAASTTVSGTTRYATNAEVNTLNSSSKSNTAVVPETLFNNYLKKEVSTVGNQAGDARAIPQIVNTYTKFTKTIECTGNDVDGVAFKGTAYRAEWADLAEYYHSDKKYPAGTLITIGSGSAEITEAKPGSECNGIISEKPGYQLGTQENENDLPVALVGKVDVLFDGDCTIHFGDKIYLSTTVPGHASTRPSGNCLGKVIEKDPAGKTKVLCSVRINF